MKESKLGRRFSLWRWAGVVGLCTGLAAGLASIAAEATVKAETASQTGVTEPARIAEVLPQGQVSGVQAVQVSFSRAVAAFGEADTLPPVRLDCEGRVPTGQGRWLDDARWTYMFETAVPAGVRCVVLPELNFRDLNGRPVKAAEQYVFDTGAPSISEIRPYPSSTIDEEQVFILRFNAAVDAEAIAGSSHCQVDGVGEKIPVRVINREHQAALMEAAYMAQPPEPDTVALLQCTRVLPPETRMSLVVGPGVRAMGQPQTLPASQTAEVHDYEVRPPFLATLSCTRERAGRPCLPIAPISLRFSAPVSRADLSGIKLQMDDAVFETEPDDDGGDGYITQVTFPGPFPALGRLTLSVPQELQDDAGRRLENAERFPMVVELADFPPLAKFASGTFGVIERFAQAKPGTNEQTAAVPLTLRHVEADLTTRRLAWAAGELATVRSVRDGEVLAWYARLRRLESGRWSPQQVQDILADRSPRESSLAWDARLDARSISLLKEEPGVTRLSLPRPAEDGPRPFEVIGVPLAEPGFHVMEIESPRLGEHLLEGGSPMYVRSGVLLTNLSVHVKQGRDDLLVWVTTLANAEVVPDAEINVLDCQGRQIAEGRTDARGVWHPVDEIGAPQYCRSTGLEGLFVSARIPADHPQAHGHADYSFVMSGWDRGIETWRFNVPTASGMEPRLLSHTVFDRGLYRAGEKVSMKHYLREETRDGLRNPSARRPDRLLIEHEGSTQIHELPVSWQDTATGGLMALSEFDIPESARLGSYSVRLTDSDGGWYGTTRFRVEEFRLPILAGRLDVRGSSESGKLVSPEVLRLDMQLSWFSGGAAMGQQVELSAVAESRDRSVAGYEQYSFVAPDWWGSKEATPQSLEAERAGASPGRQRFIDGLRFKLDEHGVASLNVDSVPKVDRPSQFVFEAAFADPNGEIQTLSQAVDIWPSSVQIGIQVPSWGKSGQKLQARLLALDTNAQPKEGVAVRLLAVERQIHSVRKRMVGGFYRYESHTQRGEPETFCEAATNSQGMLQYELEFDREGSFELVAVAEDEQGHVSRSYSTIWISGSGDLWFGGADDDRIDLIPAKPDWAVGEEAEFQVRMPFREARALVSVEREGVLWSKVVQLDGKDPRVRIPVSGDWGPNAYVSVLVLRGRLYAWPWQSFFDEGWRNPKSWLADWKLHQDSMQLSSQIDLAKPAFRFGLAELRLSSGPDRLSVNLEPDSEVVRVGRESSARVKVRLPDGSPAANGTVAFAVVDEALLELAANESWSIYEAMHPRRALSVRTASNQMEVVGRRHYGRKAVAAGGGGGALPTRQLFDTLLSWQPNVQLDANGEAVLRFRMNDSLSRFRLVALADHGANYFGSADAVVVSRQDLQLVSGLPPVVREGDRYLAQVTVRNGSEQERSITVGASFEAVSAHQLPDQTISLAPSAAATISWEVTAPALVWPQEHAGINWRFQASDEEVGDAIAVNQRVEPSVPVTTVQASVREVTPDSPVTMPVAPPAAALRRADGAPYGGLLLDASSSLVGSLEGVSQWWRNYPYSCLEQSASQALALSDDEGWERVRGRLATHMDENGLLRYFAGAAAGSDVLTAYLVSASDDAQRLGARQRLPEAALDRMLDGLQAFAQGRIEPRHSWRATTLEARRIVAMEALSRHGRVTRDMLASIRQTPEQWTTPAVVSWLSILKRMPDTRTWQAEISQARSLLVARMAVSGDAMWFDDSVLNSDPGLMATPVTSLARLLLLVSDDPKWRADVPRLVKGLLSQQSGGAWSITTENLLGLLASKEYGRLFESQPASGTLHAKLDEQALELHLSEPEQSAQGRLAWPFERDALTLTQEGEGRAWVGLRAQARMASGVPENMGFRLERRVVPVQQLHADRWSRGDIYRVEIEIHSRYSIHWAVLNDPVPAGATILGSGLGRDVTTSSLDSASIERDYPPSFIERSLTSYRAYFDYLPAGRVTLAYTLRLNAIGDFVLPATQVEALYQPDLRGSFPNQGLKVGSGALDNGDSH